MEPPPLGAQWKNKIIPVANAPHLGAILLAIPLVILI